MKKTSIFFLIFALAFSMSACKTAEEKMLEESLDAFEKSMDIGEKLASGEITEEEAEDMYEDLSGVMRENSGAQEVKTLPSWVKELGLIDPSGVELLSDSSYQYMEGENGSLVSSVHMEYSGEYDVLIAEAEKIAASAGLDEDEFSPRKMNEMFASMGDLAGDVEEMKGALFSNFFDNDVEYSISIEVSEDAILSIDVVDLFAAEEALQDYMVDDF